MKITFLIRSLDYGGAERQLIALAKGLHAKGHTVLVSVFYPKGPLEKDLREAGVPVRILNKQGRWDVFGFLSRLIKLLKQEQPDVLHGYLGVPNIITVLLKPVFSQVRMVWGVRSSNMDLNRYDWLLRLAYRIECMLSRFADLIIVNSRAGLEYAATHGFPRQKMVVIPNGIDMKRFFPDPGERRRVRAEWGVREDETLIGLVGRLDPMKDHPNFLKAAALLARERDNVRFVCVGDGPAGYRQKLQEYSRELGLADRLIWAGAREDMPAVYNALDIASSSSFGEGFPNVVGEAMACGVPCAVTDVGDSAWIVGDAGMVVQPGDPEALAGACRDIISFPATVRRALSSSAKQRIEELFDSRQLVTRTERMLAELKSGD